MLVKSSTYTGNLTDNRAITGVGFQPDLVIIKGDTTTAAVFKTASMSGEGSAAFDGTFSTANWIQSLDSDGFTLGTDGTVNSNNITYHYFAIKRETNDPDFNYGSYTGNGTDDRNITGVGFLPTLVIVKAGSGTSVRGVYFDNNDSDSSGAHRFGNADVISNSIQALQSDGFQVGSNIATNENSRTYYWFTFRSVSRRITTGTYIGNATDDRNITGVGFQPDWVLTDEYRPGTSTVDLFKPKTLSGDSTFFFGDVAGTANLIQALQSDGFQIGTDSRINESNQTYHWFTLAETSTSTSTSTSSSTSSSSSTSTTTSTSSSTSTSTTSTSSSTSTSTTTTLTSTSTSTTSTSTSTTSTSTSTSTTSTSTTSTSSSTSTSTSSSTSTTSTSSSTTTTMPLLPFAVDSGEDSSAEGGSFSVDEGTKE